MTLGFEARLVVVALASFGVITTAASLALAAGCRPVLARLAAPSPRRTADRVFLVRTLPCLLGLGAAVTASIAFLLFEPPLPHEEVGWPVLGAAASGAALLLAAAWRGARAARISAAVTKDWTTGSPARTPAGRIAAREVGTDFPVVALCGLWRPRLVVARRVVDACSDDEMAVMVAHELAHLEAHDNLRRAVLTLCPDPFGWLPASRVLERTWAEAAERAADEAATRGDERRRLALAGALVKVARLAVGAGRPPLPGSALFRDQPIAERVRSLLASPVTDRRSGSACRRGSEMVAGAVLLFFAWIALTVFSALRPEVFQIVEASIRFAR